jgi:hypothetical protein
MCQAGLRTLLVEAALRAVCKEGSGGVGLERCGGGWGWALPCTCCCAAGIQVDVAGWLGVGSLESPQPITVLLLGSLMLFLSSCLLNSTDICMDVSLNSSPWIWFPPSAQEPELSLRAPFLSPPGPGETPVSPGLPLP